MHSILWASLLASAGVAVVTTLLVEYLAKPSLEARKDQILEDRRWQRNALRDLKRCAIQARELYVYGTLKDAGPDDVLNAALNEKALKKAAELDELGVNAIKAIRAPAWIFEELIEVIATIAGFSYTFCVTGDLASVTWEQFQSEAIRLEYLSTLLTTSKWHLWRKRKVASIIKSSPLPNAVMREANQEKQ